MTLFQKKINLQELADMSSSELILNGCDPELLITGIATLSKAGKTDLSFYTNSAYRDELINSSAGVIVTSPKHLELVKIKSACLVNKNPHVAYAKIATLFSNQAQKTVKIETVIHATAIIGDDCNISPSAIIGPNVVIGNNVIIKDNVVLKSGVTIGDNCVISDSTLIYSNVVLYKKVTIGSNCIIHSGAIIGSDGFGFAFDTEHNCWVKVPQLGGVVIGNNVEIGANTTIDCGAIEDTVIEDGVKLDNQIQIAHNVTIGKNTIIAAQVGIAGSSKIGENCAFGGGSAISGHLNVTNGVKLAGFATVGQSIDEPGFYASGTGPAIPYLKWRRMSVHFENLDKYISQLKKLIKVNNEQNIN